jgi:membrane-associated protein
VTVAEKNEPFWRRHLVALILGGFALLLVVIVAGQLLDQGDAARWLAEVPEQWAYVLCLLFVWFDAVIPIFPCETTLNAASTIAAGGNLDLQLVMLAGALGPILGDSSLLWIRPKELRQSTAPPRHGAGKSQGQRGLGRARPLVRSSDRGRALRPGNALRRQRIDGALLNPIPPLLPWSVLGGALWSVYTCALAYRVATTLSGFPLASIVISSLITSAALGAVYFVDRRRRRGAKSAKPADASAVAPRD